MLRILAVLAAGLLTTVANAQSTITLFGKTYNVQRFDYSQELMLPNVGFPGDPPIPFFESEGVHWLGNNKLIMSADDISDVAIGNPDNWIIEVDLLTDNGQITGLAYSRTIARIDAAVDGFDLNPSGVTINPASTGLGANGNVVVMGGSGFLYAFPLDGSAINAPMEFPIGSGCQAIPGSCNINISAFNVNAEDVAFVPASGSRPDAFYVINQDLDGPDGAGIERWSTQGALIDTFVLAGAIDPSLAGAVAKGITYIADTSRLPTLLQRPEGIIMISYDRDFPALQALTLDGTLIATEILTESGTPAPPFRLDLTGCALRLHIESLAYDPDTGRLFLVNQGRLLTCNYMWILTPEDETPICIADFNNSGSVTVDDIFAFLSAWFAGLSSADVNNSGTITVDDIFAFLSAWFAGC